mmetsp:Transcript_14721/g.31182  ORF Transcript_14721/g.31182 Transcript_14721/m.31182 type:complete len:225 (+) Transcript_14721:357-1031(+)
MAPKPAPLCAKAPKAPPDDGCDAKAAGALPSVPPPPNGETPKPSVDGLPKAGVSAGAAVVGVAAPKIEDDGASKGLGAMEPKELAAALPNGFAGAGVPNGEGIGAAAALPKAVVGCVVAASIEAAPLADGAAAPNPNGDGPAPNGDGATPNGDGSGLAAAAALDAAGAAIGLAAAAIVAAPLPLPEAEASEAAFESMEEGAAVPESAGATKRMAACLFIGLFAW